MSKENILELEKILISNCIVHFLHKGQMGTNDFQKIKG